MAESAGVLMAVFGQPAYFAQAALAARSIKLLHADIPIAIATDQPEHPLLAAPLFDQRLNVDISGAPADLPHAFAAPLLGRVAALALSPFERTLSFDVDARLRHPRLPAMFSVLDRVEIAQAPCLLDTSRERQIYGRPLFNNGMILYRRTETVTAFLKELQTRFHAHLEAARQPMPDIPSMSHIPDAETRKRLLCSDQIAQAELFSPVRNPLGLVYAHLPDHWNWRGGDRNRHAFEPLVIDHRPALRDDTYGQLAEAAFEDLAAGDGKRAAVFYQNVLGAIAPDLLPMAAADLLARLMAAEPTAEPAREIQKIAAPPPFLESLLRIAVFLTFVPPDHLPHATLLVEQDLRRGIVGRALQNSVQPGELAYR